MKQFFVRAHAQFRFVLSILFICYSASALCMVPSEEGQNVSHRSNWLGGLCVAIGTITRPTGKVLQKIADAVDEKSPQIVPMIANSKVFRWLWHDVVGLPEEKNIEGDRNEENWADEQGNYPLVSFKCPETFGQKIIFVLLILALVPPVQANSQDLTVVHSDNNRQVSYTLPSNGLYLGSKDQCYRTFNTTLPHRGESADLMQGISVNAYLKDKFITSLDLPDNSLIFMEFPLVGLPSKTYQQFANGSFASVATDANDVVETPFVKEPLLPKRSCWGIWLLNVINFYDIMGIAPIAQDCESHWAKEKNEAQASATPTPTSTPPVIIDNVLVKEMVNGVNQGTCSFTLKDMNLLKQAVSQFSEKLKISAPEQINFEHQRDLCTFFKEGSAKKLALLNDAHIKTLIAQTLAYSMLLQNMNINGQIFPVSKFIEAVIISKNLHSHYQEPFILDVRKHITVEKSGFFGSYNQTVFDYPKDRPPVRNCSLISFSPESRKIELTIAPEGVKALKEMNYHVIADMISGLITRIPQDLAAAYVQIYRILSPPEKFNNTLTFDSNMVISSQDATEKSLKDIGNKSPIEEIIVDFQSRVLSLLELQEKINQADDLFDYRLEQDS